MTNPVAVHRLSTANVPVAERFDFWADALSSRLLQPVNMRPLDRAGDDFRGAFVSSAGSRAVIVDGFQGAVRSEVTRAQAGQRDGESVLLSLQRHPGLRVEARGETWAFGANSLLLQADDEPTVHTQQREVSRTLIVLRCEELSLPMAKLRPLMYRPLRLDQRLRTTLAGAARAVQFPGAPGEAAALDAMLRGVAELVLATVSGRAHDQEVTTVVRRYQANDVIRARLGDPTLSATAVAAELGISPRRLHQVFEGRQSVAEQIRERRIEFACRLLREPAAARLSIGAVAGRCGFHDHASFSRAFRRATGMTPRDYRAVHRAGLCNLRSTACARLTVLSTIDESTTGEAPLLRGQQGHRP